MVVKSRARVRTVIYRPRLHSLAPSSGASRPRRFSTEAAPHASASLLSVPLQTRPISSPREAPSHEHRSPNGQTSLNLFTVLRIICGPINLCVFGSATNEFYMVVSPISGRQGGLDAPVRTISSSDRHPSTWGRGNRNRGLRSALHRGPIVAYRSLEESKYLAVQ